MVTTKIVQKLQLKPHHIILLSLTIGLFTSQHLFSQTNAKDSIPLIKRDMQFIKADSLNMLSDTTQVADTTKKEKASLDEPVFYWAKDSIALDLNHVYFYKEGKVNYQTVDLTADYIDMDLNKEEVFAEGVDSDTTDKKVGKPVFKDNSESFDSDLIRYNFSTKKGYIKKIITEQDGGYLHSETTKRLPSGEVNISEGKYTTCDLEHPHYYIRMQKAKMIPGEKIVMGPSVLVFHDLTVPLFLPFGLFPNQKGKASGVIIPKYGEENARGFFLRDGGYYFDISEYMDLRLTGSYYSKGSWEIKANTNYKRRYRFNGNLSYDFSKIYEGDPDENTSVAKKTFWLRWNHRQDPKANPTQTFSASVNLGSSSYNQYNNNINNSARYLQSTTQSSVSYSKRWANTPFNFSMNMNHSQNNTSGDVDMNLPNMSLNMSRIYPVKKLGFDKAPQWLKDLEISFNGRLENRISTNDSVMWTSEMFDHMRNGYKHDIPLRTNIKLFKPLEKTNAFKKVPVLGILKDFTLTPQVQYSGMLYTESYRQRYEYGQTNAVVKDTISGLSYSHAYTPSISASLSPKIYGMFDFKNDEFFIDAVRHVITPSASVSFTPDMNGLVPNYYKTLTYVKENGDTISSPYSIYDGSIYGTPSLNKESGSVSLSLRNNLEMKIRSKRDTTDGGIKKIKILDNLNFNTSYNMFADSLNWSNINMTANTTLFNKIRLNFSAVFDPYILEFTENSDQNRTYYRVNKFELNKNGRLGRLTSANFNLDFSLNSTMFKGENTSQENKNKINDPFGDVSTVNDPILHQYVDFDIPWNLSFRYGLAYSKPNPEVSNITQTLNFSGDFSLTPKWKITYSSGWDFTKKELTYTTIGISRDLHCWRANFQWIPLGNNKQYSFFIGVTSSLLSDLKWQKRQSSYDSF